MISNSNNLKSLKNYSVFNEAKYICKYTSAQEFADYILKRIKICEMKYSIYDEYKIIILCRV
jgi:hypothetical protein